MREPDRDPGRLADIFDAANNLAEFMRDVPELVKQAPVSPIRTPSATKKALCVALEPQNASYATKIAPCVALKGCAMSKEAATTRQLGATIDYYPVVPRHYLLLAATTRYYPRVVYAYVHSDRLASLQEQI